MSKIEKQADLFDKISGLIEQARRKVAATINEEMVILYWNIGKMVKEEIIKSDRAEYKGQMDKSENPPIGLILCTEKGKEQIELLFLPKDRIKVAEYLTKLPAKELFAEKLHKAIQYAQLKLETKKL
ncbi:hypothetical protein COS91_06715 [Candidatus Desantisbacteria bacterium CG07_land_8_20_14_0_80_39_15]|uniref:YhcG N-terminal domain-containing protein n=2 Tax=unclassified Candidatus Desantisiibacteriota TaxID=3106372 RepID=A0A2H9PBU3_9BACT|nr:MAG: hypothetical protein COS91_06715 [Candidatus Desantisbacteria bacterium CG07_land_8_20_14_0_80_39_15]PIZ16477.1 MAG: hypothetical protein COY51_02695 [Candidatus Desantisbacteria bacterium CG_4_10_14_0_8_um_filter_39_17]